MRCRPSAKGFTLLELLVTLSIVAGIVAVVLACFEGGFRVYARIRDFGTKEAEVFLAGELLARDLAHLIPSADYLFEPRTLVFSLGPIGNGAARATRLRALPGGGLAQWYGRLGDTPAVSGETMLVAEGLDVTFAYAGAEEPDIWLPIWPQGTNLPVAIRMIVGGEHLDTEPLVRTMPLVFVSQKEASDS